MDSLDEILALQQLSSLASADALEIIAKLVDYSGDAGSLYGLATALKWSDELESRLTANQRATLDYYRSNAWSHREAASHQTDDAAWSWDQESAGKQVLHLRRSMRVPSEGNGVDFVRCQVRTNLGGQLDKLGRTVAAQRSYMKALQELPQFWMARGNRGVALLSYCSVLYDDGHQAAFAACAHREMTTALDHMAKHPSLGEAEPIASGLRERISYIEQELDVGAMLNQIETEYSLGNDHLERRYRTWCLNETLFLNPLNDLGALTIAARDILGLPSFRADLEEPPVLIGFFNQLKQEYASARWLLFEALDDDEAHLSDRDVGLLNTLDYPAYGLAVEKLKTAYRLAYSLLDKVAYFLNHYLGLGVPERDVSFRKIWYEGKEKKDLKVRASLETSRNWPLRGLFWLSKDLFEKRFADVMEPEAEELAAIRNHLEHKYLKVLWLSIPEPTSEASADMFTDTLAFSISREQLEHRTLHVMRLAREALIYLSLGMHEEERRRERLDPSKGLVMPMVLPPVEDNEKRRL
jgi:hypothetical protein